MERNGATPVTVQAIAWCAQPGSSAKAPAARARTPTSSPEATSNRLGVSAPPSTRSTNSSISPSCGALRTEYGRLVQRPLASGSARVTYWPGAKGDGPLGAEPERREVVGVVLAAGDLGGEKAGGEGVHAPGYGTGCGRQRASARGEGVERDSKSRDRCA